MPIAMGLRAIKYLLNLIDKQPERVYVAKPALSDGRRLDFVRQWQTAF